MMKRYEDLNISDNFMFAKVFSNVDVARDFLQDILKIKIDRITVVTEATLQEDPIRKSVHFDVLVREDSPGTGRNFDIEMQMEDTGNLPQRARYYQGLCDLDTLARGSSYDELKEQYILFICPKDIFGAGKPVYRFQNRDESDPHLLLGDLCFKNYYIFGKYNEIQDEATREYMQYFATQQYSSEKMARIHKLVEQYRLDPVAKKAYMTLEQELNLRYKKGLKEGRAEGLAEANRKLARGFRDEGVPLELISKQTGLSVEEIKAL